MTVRLRDALCDSAYTLRFTSTWAELRKVVVRTQPAAVFADPLADPGGNPEAHLIELSRLPRARLILYTCFKPKIADVLLRLGQHGIRHFVFHQIEDYPEHLVKALEAVACEEDGPPPLRAA